LGRNFLICIAFPFFSFCRQKGAKLQGEATRTRLLTFTRNLPSVTAPALSIAEGTNLRFMLRNAAWFADWFCAKVALFEFGILNFQSGFLVS